MTTPHRITFVRDLRVPVAGGVDLLADLIAPVEGSDPALPIIVMRTPYGRRGPSASSARALARDGFTVFIQSCRGTDGSGGIFTPQVDEQRDGSATLRWVREQPWFTGTLATLGESYLGYTQWAVAGALQRTDPAIAQDALVLRVTMPDFGATTWENGVFSLHNALGWTHAMDHVRGRPDTSPAASITSLEQGLATMPLGLADTVALGHPNGWYQDWIAHEDLDHPFWAEQSHARSVKEVTAPVAMLTGWYDIFLPWQLRSYAALVAAGNQPWLTIGPWWHASPEMTEPAHAEALAFLDEVFTGRSSGRATPVRAFLTGADTWYDLQSWPPESVQAVHWYPNEDGTLTQEPPAGGSTSYRYDPSDPTPSLGGPSLGPDTLPLDNTAHEQRDDVVAFRGPPLEAPVVIAGEPTLHIRFRSSAPSYDVFVRIVDVHPDGQARTVCDGIRRIGSVGTQRTDPAIKADGFHDFDVRLWPAFHQFDEGHRIGVQISSGAHPRYARNPGTGEPAATATTLVAADQQISHDRSAPTVITLPVVDPLITKR